MTKIPASKNRLHFIRGIWALLPKEARPTALLIILLSLIGGCLEMLSLGLIVPVIQGLTTGHFPQLAQHDSWISKLTGSLSQNEFIALGLGALIGAYLLKTAFLSFFAFRLSQFIFDVKLNLSKRIFINNVQASYLQHVNKHSSDMSSSLTHEIPQFISGVLVSCLIIISETLIALSIILLLVILEPISALIIFTAGAACIYVFDGLYKNTLLGWGKKRQLYENLRQRGILDAFQSFSDIKLFAKEPFFIAQFLETNTMLANAEKHYFALTQLPRLWLEILAIILIAALVLIKQSPDQLVISILPTMALFTAVAFKLLPSANRIIQALHSLRSSQHTIASLQTENSETQLENVSPQIKVIDFKNSIDFNQLIFTHVNALKPVLNRLTFSLGKAKTIGLRGKSGSGKSTIAKLLTGLYIPSSGSITVDGMKIEHNLFEWRKHIALVPQSIHMLNISIKNNIAFGVSEDLIDIDRINYCIEVAQLTTFIASLPDGIDTNAGERGVKISGGQLQRIGIARALYRDPAILILDEASSAIDPSTETKIIASLRSQPEPMTILIISHRESTLNNCDEVYELSNGRIVDVITEYPPVKVI